MTPTAIAAARELCARISQPGTGGSADTIDAKDVLLIALDEIERLTRELRAETQAKVHARARQAPVNEALRAALIEVINMCDPQWFQPGREQALRALAKNAVVP